VSGRPLRVLHVGNIANNAYNNAKILRAAGVESDVLCYGNYHIMASPEWEEADVDVERIDHQRPDWSRLTAFQRPRWFAQGPFQPAARYLETYRADAPRLGELRWRWLNLRRQMIVGERWAPVRAMRRQLWPASRPRDAGEPSSGRDGGETAIAYGARRGWSVAQLRSLFSRYDLIHAYGEEPILPCAARHRPYIAYEHGTLRVLPFGPTLEGRLVAQAYRDADAVVITNADNREAALRLGIDRYRFVPHPINESQPDPRLVREVRDRLCRQLNAEFLIFHPSRQHWSAARDPQWEKGNDALIGGLADAVRTHPGIGAIFVDWGESAPASRARLAELGIADRVCWIPPQSGPAFARFMAAADIVADQFFLGAFGGITPRALGLGRPVLLHLDAAAHSWCFNPLPPVINVRTPEQIAAALVRAITNVSWLTELGHAGRCWYDSHHSSAVVRRSLLDLYDHVLAQHSRRPS
jgi:glycosyltransferase involved in cell wall biosynthesis